MKKIIKTLSLAAVLCACAFTYSNQCQAAAAEAVNCDRQGICLQAEKENGAPGCPGYQRDEDCSRDGSCQGRGQGHHGRHGGCRQ